MISFLKDAEALQTELVKHRRYLHQNAEVGLNLPITSEYVFKTLKSMGCNPRKITDSGIEVIIGTGTISKTVLLRADMDGLKITEEAELDFKSKNGNMHACGHELHTSMLLGAAKLLKDRENELIGYVKLMFQPAEENLLGAKEMIDAGILQDPKVDNAMALHVASGIPLSVGTIVVPESGPSMAGADWFKIVVKGKGCHGAMPHTGVDPLNVIANIYFGLQEIISREIDCLDNAVLTVGVMQGGTINNVIPDTAELRGNLRTFTKKNREYIIQRIKDVAEGIAKTYRAEAYIEISNTTPSLVNDADAVLSAKNFFTEHLGEKSFVSLEEIFPSGKAMGTEDFAFVSQEVPTVYCMIGAGDSRDGYHYPMHNPKTIFDEAVLSKGAAVYAGYAIDWLYKNA